MKRTIIAATVLLTVAAGAYAGEGYGCDNGCAPAAMFTSTFLMTEIEEGGSVNLHGDVSVGSSAGATVNNTQSASLTGVNMQPPPQDYYKGTETVSKTKSGNPEGDDQSRKWNSWHFSDEGKGSVDKGVTHHIDTRTPTVMSASIGERALAGTQGNIGVNVAAGVDDVQSNTVALANMDTGPVLGTAQIFSNQSSTGTGKIGDFNLVASVGDGALAGASGNVGVNVASGLGNVQNNSLALSATTISPAKKGEGGEVIASDQNCQTAEANVTGGFTGSAVLGAGALAGAIGNIGVNIASGAGNLQHNGLAIASASVSMK